MPVRDYFELPFLSWPFFKFYSSPFSYFFSGQALACFPDQLKGDLNVIDTDQEVTADRIDSRIIEKHIKDHSPVVIKHQEHRAGASSSGDNRISHETN
jgi:hypothetical protein